MFSDKLKKSLTNKYRESTIKTMENNIKRVNKHALDKTEFVEKDLHKIDIIKPYLEEQGLGIKKTLIANIIGVLKHTIPKTPKKVLTKWEKYFNDVCKVYADKTKYKESSEKDKENHMSMNEIMEIFNKYKDGVKGITEDKHELKPSEITMYEKYIILYLYTTLPPLRSEDYYKMLLTISKKDNYINLKTGIMYIKHYKTSKTYGTRKIKLPKDLVEVLRRWYKIQKKFNEKLEKVYLIPIVKTKLESSQSQQGFTDLLNRIFYPKKISSSMLRKIYVSEILDKNLSPDERKKLTKVMGHSLEMQEFIYSRFSDRVHTKK